MKLNTRKTAVAAFVGAALLCSPIIASAQETQETEAESEKEAKRDVELILLQVVLYAEAKTSNLLLR